MDCRYYYRKIVLILIIIVNLITDLMLKKFKLNENVGSHKIYFFNTIDYRGFLINCINIMIIIIIIYIIIVKVSHKQYVNESKFYVHT